MASDSDGPIQWDTLTTVQGVTNWLLKKGSQFNIFGRKSTFQARVLTTPRRLTAEESAAVGQGKSGAGFHYMAMVRIIDPRMAHENYLDDPCELATSDPVRATHLRCLHTRIVIPPPRGGEHMPEVNDIVDIVLEPAGHGSAPYNLQTAQSLKVINRPPAAENVINVECTPLDAVFNSAQVTFLGTPAPTGEGAGLVGLTLDDGICDEPSPEFYLTHPLQTDVHAISSPYGRRTDPFSGGHAGHNGTDLAAPSGTPIYATHDGEISRVAFQRSGAGHYVNVKNEDGWETKYFHMISQSPKKVGDIVKAGDLIGYVGSTGASTGPHLHIELWKGGTSYDPVSYIKTIEKCATT